MVNSPLIRPYFLGGVALGRGTLGSHDIFHVCIFFVSPFVSTEGGISVIMKDDILEVQKPILEKAGVNLTFNIDVCHGQTSPYWGWSSHL